MSPNKYVCAHKTTLIHTKYNMIGYTPSSD